MTSSRPWTRGAVIELTAQEGDWYRISFDGKRGYVAAQYVTRYDTASGLNGAGRVTADVLNIRTAAKKRQHLSGHRISGHGHCRHRH